MKEAASSMLKGKNKARPPALKGKKEIIPPKLEGKEEVVKSHSGMESGQEGRWRNGMEFRCQPRMGKEKKGRRSR